MSLIVVILHIGQVPVVKVNFASISSWLNIERDIIEQCIAQIIAALSR